jgi:hypothetical protein
MPTVSTTCYLPDFFIFGKPCCCISLYIRSYGSLKCRPFSCQAGGRGFESLRSRTEEKYQVSLNKSLTSLWGFFVSSLIIYIHLYPKGGHGNGGHFHFFNSIISTHSYTTGVRGMDIRLTHIVIYFFVIF